MVSFCMNNTIGNVTICGCSMLISPVLLSRFMRILRVARGRRIWLQGRDVGVLRLFREGKRKPRREFDSCRGLEYLILLGLGGVMQKNRAVTRLYIP